MASVLSKYKKADGPAPATAAPIASAKPVAAPVVVPAPVFKKPEVPKAVVQEPESIAQTTSGSDELMTNSADK